MQPALKSNAPGPCQNLDLAKIWESPRVLVMRYPLLKQSCSIIWFSRKAKSSDPVFQ